jgi:hypothetical protein
MKLISTITSFVALFSVASATNVNVRYDSKYDNSQGSLSGGSCSKSVFAQNHYTYGSLQSYPYIAGAAQAACGSCWQISYNGHLSYVAVVDQIQDGFHLSLEAMKKLGNSGGVLNAQATLVDKTKCKM